MNEICPVPSARLKLDFSFVHALLETINFIFLKCLSNIKRTTHYYLKYKKKINTFQWKLVLNRIKHPAHTALWPPRHRVQIERSTSAQEVRKAQKIGTSHFRHKIQTFAISKVQFDFKLSAHIYLSK